MSYEFLNDKVRNFIKFKQLDDEFLSFINPSEDESFILENNLDIYGDILGFLETQNKIFILNGFMGSGKSTLLNLLPKGLKDNVLIFRTTYYDSTNLDDILLSLFQDFASYHNERKVVLPKVDTNVFTEKINAFIKACNNPMLFVFDSFEILNSSSRNQKDILDFIKYLSNFEKIKIVIASRSFDEDYLPSSEGVKGSIMKLLDRSDFESFLKNHNINENAFYVEQVFKNTKGHYLYASLLLNLIELLKISFPNILGEFAKRNSTFPDFIFYRILSLIPDKFLKVLWFLSLIRHGISEKAIINLKLATKEDINYLINRMILCTESGMVYLKDYYREEIEKSIEPQTKAKIHSYLAELYDSQLPKKPNERDLVISRITMRQEIDYHKKASEEYKPGRQSQSQSPHGENVDFTYLSYSKTVGSEWNFKATSIGSNLEIKSIPEIKLPAAEKKKGRFELSQEELLLLNSNGDKEEAREKHLDLSYESEKSSSCQEKEEIKQDLSTQNKDSLDAIIKNAQDYEDQFDYKSAIKEYKNALTKTSDPLFEVKKPLIITKLAICYKKIQNIEMAIAQFAEVYEIYFRSEPVKANYILLNIAQIYNETYKFILAKDVYDKILKSKADNPPSLLVRVYLDMAEIEDNSSNLKGALEYCEKALAEADRIDDLKLLSECYFKYGLYCDDMGKVETAYKYYLKCTQTSKDPAINTYLSSAYSNLASIFAEQNNSKKAVEYYNLALDVDKLQNNYEGLYFGYSKLAHLLQSESPDLALENLVKALGAARRLDDNFYAASAYIDLGDFYYSRRMNSKALKSYILAKRLVMQQPNEENIQKVNTRINDLKVRLGSTKFTQLISEFQKK